MSKQKRIKVFLMEVTDDGRPCKGYLTEIDDTLKTLQEIVRGRIDAINLTDDIVVIMNKNEKYTENCPPNRALVEEDGTILDILCGNICCCRGTDDEFSDIFEEDIEIILRTLKATVNIDETWIGIPEHALPEVKNKRK